MLWIIGPFADAHPQHVDGRAQVDHFEARFFAHQRAATICSHGQIRADLQFALRSFCARSRHAAFFFDQAGHLGFHSQMKARIRLGMPGDKIQKIPLRHQRQKFAMRRQVSEIRHRYFEVVKLGADSFVHLMRLAQKIVQKSQFVHQFERGGMNRVAAKIAEKIRVLFEHQHFHSGARQQECKDHSRRAAAHDAAAGLQDFRASRIRIDSYWILDFHFFGDLASPRRDIGAIRNLYVIAFL